MSRKIFTIASLFFAMIVTGKAQPYQRTGLGLKAIFDTIEVEIQFYSPSIVRILKSPEGKTFV